MINNPTIEDILLHAEGQILALTGKNVKLSVICKDDRAEVVTEVIKTVECQYNIIGIRRLTTRRHNRLHPRNMAIYILRKKAKLTLKELGKIFNMHHSSIIHSVNRIQGLLDVYEKERAMYRQIVSILEDENIWF